MAYTYLNSGDIEVFPSTRRSFNSSRSRQVTEAHLAGIVNKLIDSDGFVITPEITSTGASFDFNIHGYFFSTTVDKIAAAVSPSAEVVVYGIITIDTQVPPPPANTQVPPAFYELEGVDVNNVYQGLKLTIDPNDLNNLSANSYYLALLEYNPNPESGASNWKIPERSRIKFVGSVIDIDCIDGGVI